MEITIKTTITREMLENIFVTALEGGSNYWYWINSEDIDQAFKLCESDSSRFITSEAIFKSVYDYGMKFPIYDIESIDDGPIGLLDRDTFQQRLQLCSEEVPWSIQSEISDNGDSHSSDVVFQYLALGSLIFG